MSFRQILVRALVLGIFLSLCGVLPARTAWWKPERLPGSARLALEDLRYVYLPKEPSDRLKAAFQDLASCWPSELERREAGPSFSKQALVLVREARLVEGFAIHRERTRIYLRAGSDEALANGLYAICRELLGARWYWPGELGFESVGEPADEFPDRFWRERPAFVQRTLYPIQSDFGRRNGLNRKYSFNHNLARIFTQEVYESSPEVFAEIGGERQAPKRSAKYDPQPDFTHPKTVDLAVGAAREHFQKNPEANSFSLSINDNSLFDEGERTAAAVLQRPGERGQKAGDRCQGPEGRDEPVRQSLGDGGRAEAGGEIDYFRGRPNYTDLVFGFMNKVAKRVFDSGDRGQRSEARGRKPAARGQKSEVRSQRADFRGQPVRQSLGDGGKPEVRLPSGAPRRYLTALAYYWTEQSPSFELHPLVMPVLTSDRAQWHDPAYRAADKALIERWSKSGAERIATWDYYFGAPYPYPRQFNRWIGESIPYLHASGIDVFFSQLPSIWGLDGPKAWLTAELLRDPEQKPEALLDEYYANFFGAAGEAIRQFYEIAEQTRNERAGTANWIKFYKDEAGIEVFTPDALLRMRDAITLAETRAADDPRRLARVRIVSDAFTYTESYASYHRSRGQLVRAAMAALRAKPEEINSKALIQTLADYRGAKENFDELKQRLAEKPMHAGFATFNRLRQSEPTALVLAALARAGWDHEDAAPGANERLRSRLRAWAAGEARFVGLGKNPDLQHAGTELRNFLGPEVPVLDDWAIQYRASEDLRLVAADGQKGSGLRVENADIVSLAQTYPVLSEEIYLLEIEARWQVSPDNRTWVQLNWESMTGEKLQTDLLLRLPNGRTAGTQTLQFALFSPVNAYNLKVGVVTNRQYEGDYLELRRIELGQLVRKR